MTLFLRTILLFNKKNIIKLNRIYFLLVLLLFPQTHNNRRKKNQNSTIATTSGPRRVWVLEHDGSGPSTTPPHPPLRQHHGRGGGDERHGVDHLHGAVGWHGCRRWTADELARRDAERRNPKSVTLFLPFSLTATSNPRRHSRHLRAWAHHRGRCLRPASLHESKILPATVLRTQPCVVRAQTSSGAAARKQPTGAQTAQIAAQDLCCSVSLGTIESMTCALGRWTLVGLYEFGYYFAIF